MRLCSFREWGNEALTYVNPGKVYRIQENPSEPRQSTVIYFDGEAKVVVTGQVREVAKLLDASLRV